MSKTLQAVKLRNDFYRDNFRRVVLILLLSVILNIVLIGVLFFMGSKPTKILYFATSDSGKLVKLQPLSHPVLSDTAVRNWISRNVPKIYSLDYVHYRSQLNNIQKYFTQYGWQNFMKNFQGTIEEILDGKYVVSAAVTDVPYIVGHNVINNVYTWKAQVPIKVTFRKGDTAKTSNLVWQMILQRQNNASSDQFIGISQIVQTNAPDSSSGS